MKLYHGRVRKASVAGQSCRSVFAPLDRRFQGRSSPLVCLYCGSTAPRCGSPIDQLQCEEASSTIRFRDFPADLSGRLLKRQTCPLHTGRGRSSQPAWRRTVWRSNIDARYNGGKRGHHRIRYGMTIGPALETSRGDRRM